ncbi:MAG: VWA domain-containing protein [Acidobacteria bacterium]|nr:VWA domain-containing protein [Acidobacteriota bacterium]
MTNFSSVRRLPIYLVLDCSESMAGPAIEAVETGISTLVSELASNPMAVETAHLSLITFSRKARQVLPLTEILAFQAPHFIVRPGTALGEALHLLLVCVQREVRLPTPTQKGDYRPLVFLLTDGQPTDAWESAADAIRHASHPAFSTVCAIGCGDDVDIEVLFRLTDTVLLMQDFSPVNIRKLFSWMTASVTTMSRTIGLGHTGTGLSLAPFSWGQLEMPPRAYSSRPEHPRQVFLHARCSQTGQPYLLRFGRDEQDEVYNALAAHRLEVFEEDDEILLPPINSALLRGCPACPYCSNPIAAQCACGALFCDHPDNEISTCPTCHLQLRFADEPVNFNIRQTQG